MLTEFNTCLQKIVAVGRRRAGNMGTPMPLPVHAEPGAGAPAEDAAAEADEEEDDMEDDGGAEDEEDDRFGEDDEEEDEEEDEVRGSTL